MSIIFEGDGIISEGDGVSVHCAEEVEDYLEVQVYPSSVVVRCGNDETDGVSVLLTHETFRLLAKEVERKMKEW